MKTYQVKIVYGIETIDVGYKCKTKIVPQTKCSGTFAAPEGMEQVDAEKVVGKILSEVKSLAPGRDPNYLDLILKQFDNMIVQYGFVPAEGEKVELYAYVKNIPFIKKRVLKKFKEEFSDNWCHDVVTNKRIDDIYNNIGLMAPTVVNILDIEDEVTNTENTTTD